MCALHGAFFTPLTLFCHFNHLINPAWTWSLFYNKWNRLTACASLYQDRNSIAHYPIGFKRTHRKHFVFPCFYLFLQVFKKEKCPKLIQYSLNEFFDFLYLLVSNTVFSSTLSIASFCLCFAAFLCPQLIVIWPSVGSEHLSYPFLLQNSQNSLPNAPAPSTFISNTQLWVAAHSIAFPVTLGTASEGISHFCEYLLIHSCWTMLLWWPYPFFGAELDRSHNTAVSILEAARRFSSPPGQKAWGSSVDTWLVTLVPEVPLL